MIRAAIVGGSGYVGGELLRLLWFHPKVKIVAVTSQSHVGKSVGEIHRNLYAVCDLKFEKENLKSLSKEADVLFFALPHGKVMEKMREIDFEKTRVIDLSADFRLKNGDLYKKVYGVEHAVAELLAEAVYGLSEWKREALCGAKFVANPGCFPTGALLAIMPLAKAGLLTEHVVIDAKTGSSGAGVRPSVAAHYSERAFDFSAYNVFSHRHQWEIKQELAKAQGSAVDVVFTAHSAPMVRGIFTTAYVFLKQEIGEGEIMEIYKNAYKESMFVRLVESVHSSVVALSNYCDIALHVHKNKVIITSAIDNLVKGAAGQAVQNMNIMFGLEERMGLEFPGSHP